MEVIYSELHLFEPRHASAGEERSVRERARSVTLATPFFDSVATRRDDRLAPQPNYTSAYSLPQTGGWIKSSSNELNPYV